jgi:gluconolactonase
MKRLCRFALFGMAATTIAWPPQAAASQTVTAAHVKASNSGMYILRLDPALDAVIAPGTKIERVATGFTFTEGPMWREGRLWFSDVRGDKLRAVTPDGRVQVLLNNSGGVKHKTPGLDQGSDGMAPGPDGSVFVCLQGGRKIVRLDDEMHESVVLDSYQGKKLNSPNDLVFAPDGSLWFTDPPYGLEGMDQSPDKELPFNAVFRYAHGKLTPEITNLTLPNGIGFSPDGKILYVSNSGPKMYVKAFDVGPHGKLSHGHILISYPDHSAGPGIPDGLKVDMAGNVWTTGPGGIRIVTPHGKVLGQIKLPEVAANLGFAGDGHTLYITASTSIYRLRVKTRGELPLYDKQLPGNGSAGAQP